MSEANRAAKAEAPAEMVDPAVIVSLMVVLMTGLQLMWRQKEEGLWLYLMQQLHHHFCARHPPHHHFRPMEEVEVYQILHQSLPPDHHHHHRFHLIEEAD